jgi:hypothetical protein
MTRFYLANAAAPQAAALAEIAGCFAVLAGAHFTLASVTKTCCITKTSVVVV